jgi:hypothetical protein
MALHGPAEAGNFRIKVGRYGTRWYTDPLPGCEIAPASEWSGPSVSTTKPPFANKYVPMRTIADMPAEEWARLAGLDAQARYEAVKSHDVIAGRVNMQRGTIVHEWAEDRLRARAALFAEPNRYDPKALEQAERFRPALEQFFDDHQPELVAAEVVCLHRTLNAVGYGGTADAFVRIAGDVWAVDWKSRNSDHAAYLEEAAQGGAYIGAEYMIVERDGKAVRVPVPEVAGVLIVSIASDSFRAFPIDAAGAIDAYHEMHAWWAAQRRFTDGKVIGKPWAPKTQTPDRRAQLLERYHNLADTAREAFKNLNVDKDDLDAVERALDEVDAFTTVVTPAPKPSAPATAISVDGDTVPDAQINGLVELVKMSAARAVVNAWVVQAYKAGVSFDIRTKRRRRHVDIMRLALSLAEYSDGVDSIARAVLGEVSDEYAQESLPVGAALGSLSIDEAARLMDLVAPPDVA